MSWLMRVSFPWETSNNLQGSQVEIQWFSSEFIPGLYMLSLALLKQPSTPACDACMSFFISALSSQPLRHNKALPFEHQPIINTKFISHAVVWGRLRWDLWPILRPSLQYGVHKQVNSENVYYWLRCRVLSSICLSSANPLLTSNCSKYVLV